MKFIKPGASFWPCMDPELTYKQKWSLALRDPAYLFVLGSLLSILGYVTYLLVTT